MLATLNFLYPSNLSRTYLVYLMFCKEEHIGLYVLFWNHLRSLFKFQNCFDIFRRKKNGTFKKITKMSQTIFKIVLLAPKNSSIPVKLQTCADFDNNETSEDVSHVYSKYFLENGKLKINWRSLKQSSEKANVLNKSLQKCVYRV